MKLINAHPYVFSLALFFTALLLSITVGSVSIPLGSIIQITIGRFTGITPIGEAITQDTILFTLRFPHAILMALCGAALACSGSSYQGLFRNPLADPYLIGVASGAGLGAVIAMSIRWPYSFWGLLAIPIAAFLAALLTVIIVYYLARVGHTLPTSNMILAGVAVSAFASALTSFWMLRSTGEIRRALGWLLGGATQSGWMPVLAMLPYIAIGMTILITFGHGLNVLQFGDEQAQHLGLPVERVRRAIIAAATLTTAAAVSFAGIIGFVGLIVPHLVRMVWGGDYRRILPLAIINGAVMLLICDVLARTLLAPQEIPVGIITALAGAPFFLWLLRRTKQRLIW